MKTAISIPDETYNRAEQVASRLGISRSEFFTRAAKLLIVEAETTSLTERMNAALARIADEDVDDVMAQGRRTVAQGAGDW